VSGFRKPSRRSSNSAPVQLTEKNDDRYIRNKIQGVNHNRDEAAEETAVYGVNDESVPQAGFPLTPETFMLTPET